MFIQVFNIFAIPKDIVSYQWAQFTSQVWGAYLENLSASMSLTPGYHTQANGQAERPNKGIVHFLHTFCTDNQKDWAQFLPWA